MVSPVAMLVDMTKDPLITFRHHGSRRSVPLSAAWDLAVLLKDSGFVSGDRIERALAADPGEMTFELSDSERRDICESLASAELQNRPPERKALLNFGNRARRSTWPTKSANTPVHDLTPGRSLMSAVAPPLQAGCKQVTPATNRPRLRADGEVRPGFSDRLGRLDGAAGACERHL
jgi:hypothetical protein